MLRWTVDLTLEAAGRAGVLTAPRFRARAGWPSCSSSVMETPSLISPNNGPGICSSKPKHHRPRGGRLCTESAQSGRTAKWQTVEEERQRDSLKARRLTQLDLKTDRRGNAKTIAVSRGREAYSANVEYRGILPNSKYALYHAEYHQMDRV